MVRMRPLVLLATFALQALTQDPEPRIIRGTVRDSLGAAVTYAVIHTTGQSRVVSDDSGHFHCRATPTGRLTVRVMRLGYVPFEVKFDPPVSVHRLLERNSHIRGGPARRRSSRC